MQTTTYIPQSQALIIATDRSAAQSQVVGYIGRSMNIWFLQAGHAIGEKVNNLTAKIIRLGPHPLLEEIKTILKDGIDRIDRLKMIRRESPSSGLDEEKVIKLLQGILEYTSEKELPRTNEQAFECIVDIVTLFPGSRRLFLRTPFFANRKRTFGPYFCQDDILKIWKWGNGAAKKHWTYWSNVASLALSHSQTSTLMETSRLDDLVGGNSEGAGLCGIQQLIVGRADTDSSHGVLIVRFLYGLVVLPTFWEVQNAERAAVADTGIDAEEVREGEEFFDDDPPFDYEGVDCLCHALLVGLSRWNPLILHTRQSEPWFSLFLQIIGLLLRPLALSFCPQSAEFAKSVDLSLMEFREGTVVQAVEVNIEVQPEDFYSERTNYNRGIPEARDIEPAPESSPPQFSDDKEASIDDKEASIDSLEGADSDTMPPPIPQIGSSVEMENESPPHPVTVDDVADRTRNGEKQSRLSRPPPREGWVRWARKTAKAILGE
ncbi:unnamed protein product [Mycena citricolor]|uniref:Uncharacterized protein n=1 Tax=Mycena citricolor TaxID=2018698 RepID=A0AAD2Q5A9_9AGAR|nr:unnamed protein product [Mycena citricolor]